MIMEMKFSCLDKTVLISVKMCVVLSRVFGMPDRMSVSLDRVFIIWERIIMILNRMFYDFVMCLIRVGICELGECVCDSGMDLCFWKRSWRFGIRCLRSFPKT
jgi:hypothetical protein